MCGRFALVTDLSVIEEKFDIRKISSKFQPNWNVSPGQLHPCRYTSRGSERTGVLSLGTYSFLG